jgi:hypothetical protein
VANNIKLVEAHIQESLKQLNVSTEAVADAWSNFEKKYSTINIVNQSIQKTKSKSTENTADFNSNKSFRKWIGFASAILAIGIMAYFAWPYVLQWSSASASQKKDTAITGQPLPIVNTPVPIIEKPDTIKRDTLIVPIKNNLQGSVPAQTLPSVINNTSSAAPIINKPRRETKTEVVPKETDSEPKKTEGEFDFFDKPATDSLRLKDTH